MQEITGTDTSDPIADCATMRTFMATAHHCAMTMLENAAYIQGELTHVRISDEHRAQTEQTCTTLIGTKHDIITELHEMSELLESNATTSVMNARVSRIMLWLRSDITQLHESVMALSAASKHDTNCQLAYMLVAESATNILTAFNIVAAAGESKDYG